MKKIILLTAFACYGFLSAQTYDNMTYYINEIIPSPGNPGATSLVNYTDNVAIADHQYDPDDTLEYFEFRGTPNATIDADVYFISIEGDGESGKTDMGEVKDAIDLGGLTFGANGILTIVADLTFDAGSLDINGADISGTKIVNPYAAALLSSGGNVLTVQLTATPGFLIEEGVDTLDKFSNATKTRGYDGSINDQSSTYMIIKSPDNDPNSANIDIDINDDGIIDDGSEAGADMTHLNWTIYDSVSILDDDDELTDGTDQGEFAYGQIILVDEDAMDDVIPASASPVVSLNQYPSYVARSSDGAGYVAGTDWMAGRLNSGTQPEWTFSSTLTRNIPQSLSDTDIPLATYGNINTGQTDPSLSIQDANLVGNGISVAQSSDRNFLNLIVTNEVRLDEVTIVDMAGRSVLSLTHNLERINLTSLPKGMYAVRLKSGSRIDAFKIVR